MTKFKDLRKTKAWDYADIVVPLDADENEIEIMSESKRRDVDNKEVVSWKSEVNMDNGLVTLTVILNI